MSGMEFQKNSNRKSQKKALPVEFLAREKKFCGFNFHKIAWFPVASKQFYREKSVLRLGTWTKYFLKDIIV